MAIGPEDIKIDLNAVDKIEEEVDEKIRSKGIRLDTSSKKKIEVIVPGHLNPYEKNELASRYFDAGWGSIGVMNSDENGERPGLVSVTLTE